MKRTDPLVFAFPLPPNLANSRMHWRVKHNAKVKYWGLCDERQMLKLLPKPPKTPWEHVTVESHMFLGGAMDDDNAMARHKWVFDWLVTRGYLADDKRNVVKWLGLPTQTMSRGKGKVHGITLYLTPED